MKNRRRVEQYSCRCTFVFQSQNCMEWNVVGWTPQTLQILLRQLSAEVQAILPFASSIDLGWASGGPMLSLIVLMAATCCREEGSDTFSSGMECFPALQLSCKNCLSLQPPLFPLDSAHWCHTQMVSLQLPCLLGQLGRSTMQVN